LKTFTSWAGFEKKSTLSFSMSDTKTALKTKFLVRRAAGRRFPGVPRPDSFSGARKAARSRDRNGVAQLGGPAPSELLFRSALIA
jgi:hypothetical protein